MPALTAFTTLNIAAASVLGLIGLLAGSFLNVVIHRLPRMLERAWAEECAAHAGQPLVPQPPFNLALPRSHCPRCGHTLRWYENIPVLSWLALRGRCAACRAPIRLRYPLVELAAVVLFAYCGARWGLTPSAGAWCLFCAALLALACIDWDTTLLPDDLTQPLLWAGLIAAALGWSAAPLTAALTGAVAGYLALWLIYWGFKLATGKEGMGYGDFKLLAALGAWLGWQALAPVLLMSSVIGVLAGLLLKFTGGLREERYLPFGPFLAGAGLVTMVFGPGALLGAIGL